MANPTGAARHARQALKPDGHCMLVEPAAGDSLSDNLNPVGGVFYGASSLICVPVSLAQHGPALGAQAGEARLKKVMVDGGGFSRFRRATETPFNSCWRAGLNGLNAPRGRTTRRPHRFRRGCPPGGNAHRAR
jgi:hypothetical protein